MHAFAAAGLEEHFEAQFVEQREGELSGFEHGLPGQCRVRVKVEHKTIGLVEVLVGGIPGVQLEHVHLHGTEQRIRAIDDHRRLAGFGLVVTEHIGDMQLAGVLLEEQLAIEALRRPYQRHRAVLELRQDPLTDACVVFGNLALGGANAGVDDALRMRQAQVAQVFCRFGTLGFGHGLGRHGTLQVDGAGRFIVAQPMEDRMANHAVPGHLRIRNFCHQFRLEPMNSSGFSSGGWPGQGGLADFQGFEARLDTVERGGAKAGPDLAGITERAAVRVMQGEQQGTEAAAAPFGIGEPDDDELLALFALELDPVRAAPARIGTTGALADQPFELQAAGAVEQRLHRLLEVGRKLQNLGLVMLKQFTQCFAPVFQGPLAQVLATQEKKVKQVIDDPLVVGGVEGIL
ncbi:hypothetical protein D3C79_715460 [compost metagenome]